MSQKNRVIISEGMSFAYLIHTSLGVIASVVLSSLFSSWFLLVALPFLPLVFFTTGIDIDTSERRVRKYRGLFGKHWGIWLPLSHFEKVTLEEFVVTKPVGGFFRYERTSSKTYDILLANHEEKIYELNDFFDYSKAERCFDELTKLGLEGENKYAIKTAELVAKRKARR